MNVLLTAAGIAAPSLLLAAAVRRWIADVPWRVVLLFLLLTLAFLNGAVFSSKLPVPVDEAARGYPYRGVFGEIVARNPLTNDTVKLFLPWMQVVREQFSQGCAPLWNPYAFAGYPLLGNGESAPFAPFFLATLFVPLPKQIVAMAGLKIFTSLLFGFLWLKRLRMADASAAFGAAAFAFSVFQTVYLYYSTTAVTALAPAAFFAVSYAMDTGAKRGVVLFALVVAALMASGHPESVLHIAIGSAVLLVIDFAVAADRRAAFARLRFPVVGGVAGLLLSLPAWLPVAEQVRVSTRLAELRGANGDPPFPWTAAWAMVAPNGFGNPARHNWSWIRNYSTVSTSYIGLLVLGLFFAAMLSRTLAVRYRLYGAAAIVLFLTAMQWTVIGRAANQLPLLSITANEKLRFVALFLAATVAAKFVDEVRGALLFAGAALPIVTLCLYVWWNHQGVMKPIDLAGAVGVIAFAFVLTIPHLRRHAAAAAFVITVAELLIVNVPFNALVDGRYFRPRLPIVDAVRARRSAEPFRTIGLDWVLVPNGAAQYGLEDVRGSDPMSFAAYTDFLRRFTVASPGTDVLRVVDADQGVLDFLNVSFLIAEPAVRAVGKWREVYRGADGVLYENTRVLPRFFAPAELVPGGSGAVSAADLSRAASVSGLAARSRNTPADIAIRQSGPSGFDLQVRAPQTTFIASSEPAGSGWRVRVNGRTVAPRLTNGAFIGFYVPAGESRIEIRYVPASFYASLIASLLAGAGLIGAARRARFFETTELVE